LFEALRRTGYASIAKLTMHNREHIVVLRPGKHGLILHTLYYRDEVRAVDEFRTDTSQIKDKELDLATMLIDTLAASFEPEKYSDSYRENIRALIDAKIQGQQIVAPPAAQAAAPVLDILEALKVSIAQLKKPAASTREVSAEQAGEAGVTSIDSGKRKRTRKVAGLG